MKKSTLVAFLAVMALGLPAANAAISLEGEQNIQYYMGPGPCPVAAPRVVANVAAPCPVEYPCTPVACPANRGLFDGGMCCGGRAVPPLCGC